jgi:hypothetical protein
MMRGNVAACFANGNELNGPVGRGLRQCQHAFRRYVIGYQDVQQTSPDCPQDGRHFDSSSRHSDHEAESDQVSRRDADD